MEEAVMYGVAVALLMLGVPLWHSMGECRKGRLVRVHLCRWWLLCGLMVMSSLIMAVLVGIAGFVLQNSPPPRAAGLSAECRILSKSVDLRSAKICDVAHVVHLPKSLESTNVPSKFRCFLDYYWTSVFKVEYTTHTSRSIIQAGAEVPNEALPMNCRPGFGAAWKTKETYQVNETYPCKYSPKNLKMVDIAADIVGNCSTNEPSKAHLIRQFWYLLVHSENSVFSPSGKTGELFSRAAAAIGLGICYSVIVTGFTRSVRQLHFRFEGKYTDLDVVYFEARVQLAILFIVLLLGLIWLSNHYVREDFDMVQFIMTLYRKSGIAK